MANKTCPKCESDHWMVGLEVRSANEPMSILVSVPRTDSWRDFNGVSKIQKASMCGDCGYTEFYADDPKKVWAEWQKQRG